MPPLIDLTGKYFGRLKVIKRAEKNTSGNKPQWECECSCGSNKIIIVSGSHLRNGHTQSCGCLQKEKARAVNFKDLTNQRFGNLLVLENSFSNSKSQSMWKCKCNCGSIIYVRGADLKNGHTKSCGCINSFGEKEISNILSKNGLDFKKQYTINSCRFQKTNALAKFDFAIFQKDQLQYLIEYDGKQHFICDNSGGWNTEEEFIKRINNDQYKNEWCKKNNIPLIRVPYTLFGNISLDDLLLETTKSRVV